MWGPCGIALNWAVQELAADQWRAAGLERLAWYIDSSHPVQLATRL